ncbi:MAG: hemolysin III family protein [Marinicella sp.]|nr:hemolysin III family protein [Xanthomonadales bacterium]
MKHSEVKFYPPSEEKINIISHALGLLFSLVGFVLLMVKAVQQGTWIHFLAYGLYSISMMVLFTASTIYHRAIVDQVRSRLRVFDHAAIYVLIAGTYTPFMLLVMPGTLGYSILAAAWGMAVLGIVLKLFFTGRFSLISTSLYLFMGWAIVFAIKPLAAQLSADGLFWLVAGGVAYTIGAILYAIKQIPFNHAIFHVFVLIGAFSHFLAIYFHSI